jgi:DNA-binding NarL/FixJ family response regulator
MERPHRARILVADDSPLIRRGVARVLSGAGEWEVCGEAGNGAETLQRARELRPDLVLLDISMPGFDGLATTRLLRSEIPEIKILILSHHEPRQVWSSARDAGANGCLDKNQIATGLIQAVREVLEQR